jgi:hypothetical protein
MNVISLCSKLAGILLAIGFAGTACAGEFKYSIPPGWRDLLMTMGSQDTSAIPREAVADAASGTFAVYAFDPANTTEKRIGASFNAVEAPTTGRLTEAAMESYAVDMAKQMRAAGLTAGYVDSGVISMNGAEVGRVTLDVESEQGGSRRLVQYLITGKKSSAALTYAAPKDEFARYVPVFNASVRATTGGYTAGGFNWRQTIAVGVFAGICGLLVAFVKGRAAKRDAAVAASADDGQAVAAAPVKAPAAPQAKPKSYVWTCPGCGKPVPLRIDQCRCGTAKPA